MRLPFVSRARYDRAVYGADVSELRRSEAETRYNALLDQFNARYADLLDKYHALRVAGANPAEPSAPVVTSPLAELGPLTRAALAEMANGQSGAVVRAMRTKALAVWLDYSGNPQQDEIVARAVWAGEAVNPS